MGLLQMVNAGVVSGNSIEKILEYGKKNNFAIPSVSVINMESINATLEAASKSNSAIILEINSENTKFIGGKIAKGNPTILGAVATAQYIHSVASYYKIPVIITAGYALLNQLEWLDKLLELSENSYKKEGKALFTLHSIDLRGIHIDDAIKVAQKYLKRVSKIGVGLELKFTDSQIDSKELTSIYEKLYKISSNLIIEIDFQEKESFASIKKIDKIQKSLKKEFKTNSKPLNIAINKEYINNKTKEYINTGIVKINIDKQLQTMHIDVISEIANDADEKYHDIKKVMREIQKRQIKYITSSIKEFNSKNTL